MITLDDIRTAESKIRPHVDFTPLRPSVYFSERTGFDVYLKLETLQPTGSFKIRGALNLMLSLSVHDRLKGVVAWSAGNHGLGVSYAASVLDVAATIFVPKNTPSTKLRKLRRFAIDLQFADTYEECEAQGKEYARKTGAIIVHPYDDWRTVAGQGTVGLELHQQMPELDAVLVPVGGGGLISGTAIALHALDPEVKIIAVQSSKSPSLIRSLEDEFCYEEFPVRDSIVEGLAGGIGKIVFGIAKEMIDEFLLVDERVIPESMVQLIEEDQIVAESSAAICLPALDQLESLPRGSRVAIVLTGSNLNKELIREFYRKQLLLEED